MALNADSCRSQPGSQALVGEARRSLQPSSRARSLALGRWPHEFHRLPLGRHQPRHPVPSAGVGIRRRATPTHRLVASVGSSVGLRRRNVQLWQPDGTFITTLDDLRHWLAEIARAGEAVVVDGLATRVQRPRGWANQKVLLRRQAAHPHRPGPSCLDHPRRPAVVRRRLAGQLPRARAACAGRAWRAARRGRGRQPAGPRIPRHGQAEGALARPGWGPRIIDRLSPEQRAYNRLQAGLRALVEQSIAIWPTPGRCAAGAGCWTASGRSTAPPACSSASAGGCIESPHDRASPRP
jgi:hypothetical protein